MRRTEPSCPATSAGPSRSQSTAGAHPWHSGLVFAGFVGLTVLYLAPGWRHPTTDWSAFSADSINAMWMLSWTPFAITHALNPLFTHALGYPVGTNLAWNPTSPLLAVVSWPGLFLAGPILQYNVALTVGLASSAWAAHVAAYHFVRRRHLAILSGLAFGISPYVTGQALGHPYLAVVPGTPLLVVALDQAWRGRHWGVGRAGAALGGCVLLTVLMSEEVLASSVVVIAAAAAVVAFRHRRTARSWIARQIKILVVALLVAGPILVGILIVQFGWPGRVATPPLPAHLFSGDLTSFALPSTLVILGVQGLERQVALFSANSMEAGLYVGLPFLLLLVWAWHRGIREEWMWVLGSAMFTAGVLALGPTLHVFGHNTGVPLPEALVNAVPVMRDLVPVRFSLYVSLGMALLLPGILAYGSRPGRSARAAGLLTILGVASWLPYAPPALTGPVPSIFRHQGVPGGAVALFGPADATVTTDLPMLWQAVDGMRFRTAAGYVVGNGEIAASPWLLPPFERLMLAVQRGSVTTPPASEVRRAVACEFTRRGVTLVVVGPMPHEAAAVRIVGKLLGHSGIHRGGVWLWERSRARWGLTSSRGAKGCGRRSESRG